MARYKIQWVGAVRGTLDDLGVHPGPIPTGGSGGYDNLAEAEAKLERFLSACGEHRQHLVSVHKPKVVPVRSSSAGGWHG